MTSTIDLMAPAAAGGGRKLLPIVLAICGESAILVTFC
jgi:hypothetical protein